MKTGLVMEGGAMRGMFTCGVIDVFLEQGITFEGAAGISAGATFGCNFKSKQIGRPLRYNITYGKDPRYCSMRSLITTGDLFGADFCYRVLPEELDIFDRETFEKNHMDFYVGATDVETGKCIFHNCKTGDEKDILWMRASASMPLVSRPVEIDGRKYLDGGITCSVPYRIMEQMGYERNVIILTQPLGYEKKKSTVMPKLLKGHPAIGRAMAGRHRMYQYQMEEIRKRELAGTCLVIRPKESLHISRTEDDPKELERVYQLGREEAFARLPEIEKFLE